MIVILYMAIQVKEKAINLRKLGFSYSLISIKTGIPKSTLNYWLKKVPYKPNKIVLKRIQESPIKSAKILRERRLYNIKVSKEIAFKELGKVTKRDFLMMGIGLYIGEGSKNSTQMVRISNSDPRVIKLIIAWLISACGLSINNLRIAIHTYPDLDIEKTLEYWSNITHIPRKQFRKTQIDNRLNKSTKNIGKSLHGTAHITVNSNGQKEFGVFLFRKIMGWIESIENQVNAGIV